MEDKTTLDAGVLVYYQGTAPGMGRVCRHFGSKVAARQWSRQIGRERDVKIIYADAAPELLEALEWGLRVWFDILKRDSEPWTDRARAAIAKAKGE